MFLFPSPELAVAAFFVVVFAAIVQAGFGMGFGQAAAPLLALIDPHLVPVPVLFISFATSGWAAWHERDGINWGEVRVGTLGRGIGVVAGTALMAALTDPKMFMLIFGGMIGLGVLVTMLGKPLPFGRPALVSMGTLSGLMGTITSIGAPPMALVYQGRTPQEARPTLAAFFAIGCALSLVGLYVSGWAGVSDILLALGMVPAMVLGTLIARRIGSRFDRRFRQVLLLVSGIAAVTLIYRGLA